MNIDRIIEELIRYEGFKNHPYKCSEGYLTIGYGRNLEIKGISKGEAFYLLENDIDDCIEDLEKYIPWINELDEDRQEVLVNMCFNLGINGLLKFQKFLINLKEKNFKQAKEEMLDSIWATQVPSRAKELSEIILGSFK